MDNLPSGASPESLPTKPLSSLGSGSRQSTVKALITVLIVAGSPDDCATYIKYIHSDLGETCRCFVADNLDQAIKIWQTETPNLVLLERDLRDGDGYRFLEIMKANLVLFGKLPLVILAEQKHNTVSEAVQAMKLGAADYLIKQELTQDGLSRAVQQALNEACTADHCHYLHKQQAIVAKIALRIRASLQLAEIAQTIVQEVYDFLKADRVLIYQFQPDLSGIIIAETVTEPWLSAMNSQIADTCFQGENHHGYKQGQLFVANDIYDANLTDCHIELLEKFQVRANIAAPILIFKGERRVLWGLLIVHQCAAPRIWQEQDLDLIQQLSVQLEIAIQQSNAYANLERELQVTDAAKVLIKEQVADLTAWRNRYEKVGLVSGQILYEFCFHTATITWGANTQLILGYSIPELPRNLDDWVQLIHPEDRQRFEKALKHNRLNKIPFFEQYRVKHRNEYYIWVEDRNDYLLDNDGTAIGVTGAIADITKRKQDELELQHLNQSLELEVQKRTQELWQINKLQRTILDSADYAMITLDLNGTVQTFNAGAEKMFGYSMSEVVGCYAPAKFHDFTQIMEVAAALSQELGRSITPGLEALTSKVNPTKGLEQEWIGIRKDGSRFPMTLNVTELHNEQDQVIGYLKIGRDISERKQIEKENLDLKERVEFLLASSPAMIYSCQAEGDFDATFISGNVQRILGYTPWQFTKERGFWASRIHPEDASHVFANLEPLFKNNIHDHEYRYLHRDGHYVWLHDQLRLIRDPQGKPIEIVGYFADISERKRIELQLHQQAERLALAMRSGAFGCWEYDMEREILFWDDPMYELYGVTKGDEDYLPYETWVRALHPEDRELAQRLAQVAITEQKPYDHEFRIVHSNGSVRFIKAYATILWDEEGSAYRMIGVNFDISDLKRNQQIIRQQATREALLRQITQRIRQSLALPTIFNTACQEIQQLLQCHRVCIFQFYPESNFNDGEIVAESVVGEYTSAMKVRVHDHCFGGIYASSYAQGRIQAVSDIYAAGLSDCHRDILAQFNVTANLVIPLLCGNDLWGLLCVHQCDAPRQWQEFEIELIQQIANQLAIAIQQANLYQQIQTELVVRQQAEAKIAQQLRRLQVLSDIVTQIRESLNITEILSHVTQQIHDLLSADRVIVFRLFPDGRSQIVEEVVLDGLKNLKNMQWEDEVWDDEIMQMYWRGQPRIIPDVMNDIWTDCLVEYSREGQIQSKIVAPILQEVDIMVDGDRWVHNPSNSRIWGVLVVHACKQKRIWKDSEAQLLQQIANQLAIAIKQATLFEQLQQELGIRHQAEQKLKQTNLELAQATKLKDEFLANMSHELRTPLNSILGLSNALGEEILGSLNEKQLHAVGIVEKSGEHLLSLINDILDLSKISSGMMELNIESVSVRNLCDSSLVFIKQQAFQKRIQITSQIPFDVGNIHAEERRIKQVLINLLTNAVKFTPPDGEVCLRVSFGCGEVWQGAATVPESIKAQHKSMILFQITDTGIGIAETDLQKLFQPFIQVSSSLNRQYEGTGLGLALVKQIIELHDGQVMVESTLGKGSCFTVALPYAPVSQIRQSPRINSVETEGSQPTGLEREMPMILLAEDNEANIQTFTSYLTAVNYRLIIAHNGQEAVNAAETYSPDIILMDIQMPDMDGLEAIRRIRGNPVTAEIPIIALTALAMTGDRERCLEAGANEYMSKPVRFKQLNAKIQEILKI
ncbi:MAG: PAS domain-containing protein [Pseudanabaenaceae cyanobacterium]